MSNFILTTPGFEIYGENECDHSYNNGEKCLNCGAVYNESTLEWEFDE